MQFVQYCYPIRAQQVVLEHRLYCYECYTILSCDFSTKKQWKNKIKNCIKKLFIWRMSNSFLTCKFKQKLILKILLVNLSHLCLYSDWVDGYAVGMFFVGLFRYNIIFVVGTDTTTSYSLDRHYGPLFILFLLDVYD